jgi:hypothetical protein
LDSDEGGGVSIESADGAVIENVVVERVRVVDTVAPIFVRLGARGWGQPEPRAGSISAVEIRDLVSSGSTGTSSITGLPGARVGRVELERVVIGARGGRSRRVTWRIPERARAYPQCIMFGVLPAWSLYARHVEHLTLDTVDARLDCLDARPWLVTDDVGGLERREGSVGRRSGDGDAMGIDGEQDGIGSER